MGPDEREIGEGTDERVRLDGGRWERDGGGGARERNGSKRMRKRKEGVDE